ncbi:2-oxo acid dehydrogenase subunit E2 [Flavobacteriaceae bacterium]|nr:2-oxo acid dehydrogenase subunit E2 [Flavobacteriaceae bacterium]MDB0069691.1 2-oxo acid dehydrogenase subunit E2 [Flavobacteriaceae bacterium]MDC1336798.1 2-oxo acid dehydrogenase subunit E2 [Flavobacteriaceae bacterium]|tara:strand:+ start:2791 stop:4425 length:1635 start_codon:yes stop_codon:yes gene_type:complete
MAEIINMPRLSDTMEEGVVAKWLVNEGDTIKEGDILAEIETDKATMEFESFHDGVLLHIGIKEGETAAVDTLLAIVGEKDEDISGLLSPSSNSGQLDLVDQINESENLIQNTEDQPTLKVIIPVLNDSFQIVTMPRLSDTMEEGTVSSWLVNVGDVVKEGDILAEIETDKATMEFESFHEGTLLFIGINVGETAKVDTLLAVIGDPNSDYKTAIDNFGINPIANDKVEIEDNPTEIITENSETITESVKEPISNNENLRVLASPLAKKIAKEKSIDLNLINGSGDNGRIIKEDVENFTPTVVSDFKDNSPSTIVESGTESFDDIENSQMRKTIARRLKESKFSAPHYYLSVEFEMDNAIAFRNQYNSLPETKISFNDIVVKACAIALKQHPRVNSQWFDDKMRLNHHVHVGVAVGVPDGLVVPVIRFANEKSIPEIGSLVKSYASKARDKKLSPDEMQGSTFTVSNLGMFGIEEFTSIINQPNSAILSVGTIVKKPVVREDKITIGHTMKITLACDHRTVDGVTGSLFLQTLKGFVENPVTMLV